MRLVQATGGAVSTQGGNHTNADRKPPEKLQFHQFHRSFHVLPSVTKAAAVTIVATLDSAGRVSEEELKTDIRRWSMKLKKSYPSKDMSNPDRDWLTKGATELQGF